MINFFEWLKNNPSVTFVLFSFVAYMDVGKVR